MEGQCEAAISEISYPSMYQNVTGEIFMFFEKIRSSSLEYYHLEPGSYHSTTDIVEPMNMIFQGSHSNTETSFGIKVSRRTQKIEIDSAKEGSVLAFFFTDMGHFLGIDVVKKFGVMLWIEGRQKPVFAYDIVRMHFLKTYTNLLCTKFLATQRFPCFAVFVNFPL